MPLCLTVYFAHQRACGIYKEHFPRLCLFGNRFRHAMRRKNNGTPIVRNFVEFFYKDRAFFAQAINDIFIMHYFVTHIDRRAIFIKRPLNDLDCTIHTCAETARRRQENFEWFSLHASTFPAPYTEFYINNPSPCAMSFCCVIYVDNNICASSG